MKRYKGYWTEVYWKEYYSILSENDLTYKQAWIRVEEWHWEKFEFNKYEDFESFRQGMHYRQKKRKGRSPAVIKKKRISL